MSSLSMLAIAIIAVEVYTIIKKIAELVAMVIVPVETYCREYDPYFDEEEGRTVPPVPHFKFGKPLEHSHD